MDVGNYQMYLYLIYFQDNMFILEMNVYWMLYIMYNMINYMYMIDQDYVNKLFVVFNQMIVNCILISIENFCLCFSFFEQLIVFVDKVENCLNQDVLF